MKLAKLLTATAIIASAFAIQSPANALGPAGNYSTGYACTHSGGNLILRAGPGQQFAKLAGISYGTTLVILNETTDRDGMSWYKVRLGKRIGYVRYDYVCGL